MVGPDEDPVPAVHCVPALLPNLRDGVLHPFLSERVEQPLTGLQLLEPRPGALGEGVGGGLDVVRPRRRTGNDVEVRLVAQNELDVPGTP